MFSIEMLILFGYVFFLLVLEAQRVLPTANHSIPKEDAVFQRSKFWESA